MKGKEFKSHYITRTKTMREKRERGKEIEYFIQFLENGKLVEDMPWLKHGELNKYLSSIKMTTKK